ncbi:MAG: hypothetical protein ACKO38_07310, partial [Planctomycetota bacterium]
YATVFGVRGRRHRFHPTDGGSLKRTLKQRIDERPKSDPRATHEQNNLETVIARQLHAAAAAQKRRPRAPHSKDVAA